MQNAGFNAVPPARPAAQGAARGWDRITSVSMVELLGLLIRQLPIMIIIFIALFALGMIGVMTLKKSYTANGRILVQYGEEYIYNPVIGTAGQGTAYTADQMIQAEVGFFTSVAVREKVLQKIGLRSIFPDLAAEYVGSDLQKARIRGKALEEMGKNMGAYTAPNQPLISVSYRSKNPEMAAEVLKALINEYLVYRQQVLLDSEDSSYGKERQTTENKLLKVNAQLETFLKRNGIGDFETERAAANTRLSNLNDQLLAAKARQKEIDAGIRARSERLAIVPEEVVQYTDDASSGQLAAARVKREQLLAKYKPNSKPVQAIDAEIQRLSTFIESGKNKNLGTVRTGVNPVHQNLQAEKLNLEAEAQSITEKIAVLGGQIAAVKARQQKFQQLFPEYQSIASKVDVLQSTVKDFSTREEQYQARRNLAEEASNNIRVIEWPVVPFQGKSLKKPAAILVFLFAGFTALMVGLGIVFSNVMKSAGTVMVNNRTAWPENARSVPEPPDNGGFGNRAPRTPAPQPQAPPVAQRGWSPHVAAPANGSMHAPQGYAGAGYGQPVQQPSYPGWQQAQSPANQTYARPPQPAVPRQPRQHGPGGLPVIANIGPKRPA